MDSLSLNNFLQSALSPLRLFSYKTARKKFIQELKILDRETKGKKS